MTATYDCIATTTLGSDAATITFSSISSNYTDLILILNIVSPGGTVYTPNLRFNGDTGSNYSSTALYGTGSSAVSTRDSSVTSMTLSNWNGSLGTTSPQLIHIFNYANTTTNKTVLTRGQNTNTSSGDVSAAVGLWRSTAAINSITLRLGAGNYATGTMATLYGIKAE